MTIGNVIAGRYQVIAKLGYGSASTIWHCWDIGQHQYIALKIYASNVVIEPGLSDEISIFAQLSAASESDHSGRALVRSLRNSFHIKSEQGRAHLCLAHDVLGEDMYTTRQLEPSKTVKEEYLRFVIIHLLLALDYLHSECSIIHGDIKEANILSTFVRPEALSQISNLSEFVDGSFVKCVDGYNLYRSLSLASAEIGLPVLCDLSVAVDGRQEHSHWFQPRPYRAPEVLIGVPWSYPADIWNVGAMAWEMYTNKDFFHCKNSETEEYSETAHLGSMVGLLGLPDRSLLSRGTRVSDHFTADGEFRHAEAVSHRTWADAAADLQRESNPDVFLAFLKRMIAWNPQSRSTARELLDDPWILKPYLESIAATDKK